MRVAVFGLGCVGNVSAACLASLGHDVIGVDVNAGKVDAVNAGLSPVVEPGLEDIVRAEVASGRLRATCSAEEALTRADVAVVCVGTPSADGGAVDLAQVRRVTEEIGVRRVVGRRLTVVFRCTMPPRTVENILLPILRRASRHPAAEDLSVAVSPEFLREGSAVQDFFDPPMTVIGSASVAVGEEVAALFHGIPGPVQLVSLRVAELVKYASNAFHALKVSFANEIGSIAGRTGVDPQEVMRVFCRDTKLNLAATYLRPGSPFGGPCLPKDLRGLIHFGRTAGVAVPLLEAILSSNQRQKEAVVRDVEKWGKKRIGILGLAFKAGTDDLRDSPIVELVETLLAKGYDVRVFDSNVRLSRLVGANRAYVDRVLPRLEASMVASVDELWRHAAVVVRGNSDPFFATVPQALRPDQIVVDLVRMTVSINGSTAGKPEW